MLCPANYDLVYSVCNDMMRTEVKNGSIFGQMHGSFGTSTWSSAPPHLAIPLVGYFAPGSAGHRCGYIRKHEKEKDMPNWVMNEVRMDGKGADALLEEISKLKVEDGFFEHFLPMPEGYRRFDTTNYTTLNKNSSNFLKVGMKIGLPYEKQIIVDQEYFDAFRKEELKQKETGVVGWYDWHVKHWGCKWDVGDTLYVNGNCIRFDTPWGTPVEFFIELSKKYPTVRFTVLYCDMDDIGGGNCGCYVVKNGRNENLDKDLVLGLAISGNVDFGLVSGLAETTMGFACCDEDEEETI